MMYWHRAWSMSMTSCFTWRMLYHADSKTIIYLLQRRQKTFSATSSSASNVIYPIPRPGEPRSNPWTLQDGSPSLQQNTTTWPPPQHRRFHIYPSSSAGWLRSCWERPPLPAQRRRSSNQSENILAARVNSRNNIHPLKFKEVRHSQCQSMSFRSQATVNSSQICSQASAPSSPHFPLCAKLMSTTVWLDCKAMARAWPWIQSPVWVPGVKVWIRINWSQSIWNTLKSLKKVSGAAILQSKIMTHNPHIKCAWTCSNIICHIYTRPLISRRSQNKDSPEPPRTQSIRCALMPLRPMRQARRFRWVTVRLIFSISANSWRNATVQGSSSISQTTPTTTSTHLGPKFTAPRPLHLRSRHCPPNWCQRPICWTARLWLRPGHCAKHSEQSNFDACWKKREFPCIDLKVLGLKRGCFHPTFLLVHHAKSKHMQNYWRSHDAKTVLELLWNVGIISEGRIEHYHYEASNTFHLNFATKPVPGNPQQALSSIPLTLLLIFKAQCVQYSL